MARSEARRLGVAERGLALVGALALVLAACAAPRPNVCPPVAILGDAGTLTKFVPGAPQTPENVMYTVTMTEIDSDCAYRGDTREEMENNLRMAVRAQKGPALASDSIEVPYFVAVLDRAGTVLNKRVLTASIDFDGAQAVSGLEETWQYFNLRGGGGGPSFEIWSGFQLSDAELQYNREQQAGN